MQPVQDLTVEDRVSRTQFQYTMEDADARELAGLSSQLVDKLRTLPQLRDVASDQQAGGLQADLVIDRDTASRLGILPQQIDNTLYDAFGQRQVSTIFTQLNQYHVILEVDPQFQQNPGSFKDLYVKSISGTQVPLSAFTQLHTSNTSLAVNHQGQFPVVTLSFNLAPGKSLGDATKAIAQAEAGNRDAAQRSHRISGNGSRISEFAFHRTLADRGRHRDRVYRAGSSL